MAKLDDDTRKAILALHAQGLGRNAIARQLHIAAASVTAVVQAAGLSFERGPGVIAGTEARKADARRRRAELVLGLIEDAHRLRDQMFSPTKAFNIGGRDNTYTEHPIDEPTFGDKRALTQAIANLINTVIRVEEHDAGTGLPQALSLLERIADGITSKWGNGDDEFPDAPADAGASDA